MKIKTTNLISISEANQNFSRVTNFVENYGDVIILKNNKPKYIVSNFADTQFNEQDKLELIARRILSQHKHAFEVLGQ